MDRTKMGAVLKQLRKEKGLTQEQLAEHFYVSSRTVSRWETGSNLPDVQMLIDLADFYGVDIRYIMESEPKPDQMDQKPKETMKKVAAYAAAEEKRAQSKWTYLALGTAVSVLLCDLLFEGERTGLLYGIVPASVCSVIMMLVYGLSAALLVSYLKARLWQESPANSPLQSVGATVVSKAVKPGTYGAGRSKGGCSYCITFLTESGQTLELFAYEVEFGGLKEGMRGKLTFQDRYFVSFEAIGSL